jgi:hypothetical protein
MVSSFQSKSACAWCMARSCGGRSCESRPALSFLSRHVPRGCLVRSDARSEPRRPVSIHPTSAPRSGSAGITRRSPGRREPEQSKHDPTGTRALKVSAKWPPPSARRPRRGAVPSIETCLFSLIGLVIRDSTQRPRQAERGKGAGDACGSALLGAQRTLAAAACTRHSLAACRVRY